MVDFVSVIRFQILARTETVGGPEGPPIYFAGKKETTVAKPFLTYDEQIDKLMREKHLQIADTEYAKAVLKNYMPL